MKKELIILQKNRQSDFFHAVSRSFTQFLIPIFFIFLNLTLYCQPSGNVWTTKSYYKKFPYSSNLDCSNDSWKLVMYDEFNGTNVNFNMWKSHNGDTSLVSRTKNLPALILDENLEVSNGTIKIYAKKEQNTFQDSLFEYSTGFLWSKESYTPKYGKFEAKIKVVAVSGLRSAFWTWGGHEIDIIEYLGNKPKQYTSDLHHGDGNHYSEPIKNKPNSNTNYSTGFFIYAVEWSPHKIEWFVNNVSVRKIYRYQYYNYFGIYKNVTCSSNYNSGYFRKNLLFGDNYQYVILNLAVEDDGKSGFLDDNDLPTYMEVDYVRIYQKSPQQPGFRDLCDGEIAGNEEICFSGIETYSFEGDYDSVTWLISNNLNLVGTTTNSITVSPKSSGFSTGWVKATVDFIHAPCSTKTYTKTLHTGQLITGTINQGSPQYSSQSLTTVNFITQNTSNPSTTFNVDLNNLSNPFHWQITSGNGTIGGTNWNPQLITIPSNSNSLSCEISTTTDCGVIARTVAFVPTSGWYRIGPNPTNGLVSINAIDDFEVMHTDEFGEIAATVIKPQFEKAIIYNFNTGEQVFSQQATQPLKSMYLNIDHLPKGRYVLKVINGTINSTYQILKE